MRCEDVQQQLVSGFADALTPQAAAEVAAHMGSCPQCSADAEGLREAWRLLGEIPAELPASGAMRARFDAALAGYRDGHREASAPWARIKAAISRQRWLSPYPIAAAAATLLLGIAIGRQTLPSAVTDPQIAALRQELQATRQMVTLSLMQQQSASERLKGVSWSSQLDRPGNEIVNALLDTLMHDPNVNVRLASIDALQRFAESDKVRGAAIRALDTQTSPLVQMALIDFVVETQEREAIGALRRLSRDQQVNEAVRSRAVWGIDHLEAT